MTVHAMPGSGGSEQADPHVPRTAQHPAVQMEIGSGLPVPAPEAGPGSCLDLLNRTIADAARTANAVVIVTAVAKSVARVVLSVGVVLALIATVAGLLASSVSLGQAVCGAVAIGGTTAVIGVRYLRNRSTDRQETAPEEVDVDG